MIRRKHQCYIAGMTAAFASFAGSATADITGSQLGTGAPPAVLAGVEMKPFPFDPNVFPDVGAVTDKYEREYRFTHGPMSVRQIGAGWATWSHGYTGNVYYSNGLTTVRIDFPRGIRAAYLYVEPNPFGFFRFNVKGTDGNQVITETFDADGSGGAFGVLYQTTPESDVVFVEISSEVDFAVGEFGVADFCPADLNFDQVVDFADFLVFLGYYDVSDRHIDYTQDGIVDFSDYLVFLDFYGNSCVDN